ncbi:MAG: lipid A-modifier LpxR family protein [Pseudomonadota bacterium]
MRAFIQAAFGAAVAGFLASAPVWAEPQGNRNGLGTARLFTNDALGDGKDRWKTGSYQVSHFRGGVWTGELTDRPGEVLEYRLRTDIIAAADLKSPDPGDRRYAGVLSFGVHTPFARNGWDLSAGGDLVFTGPQTGIGEFQDTIHDWIGAAKPDLSDQIENGVHPTALVSAARPLSFAGGIVRPYAELQAGYETLARVGVDVVIGSMGDGALLSRDGTTGTLLRADHSQATGFSVLLGADYTAVEDSVLLPADDGFDLEDRTRVRLGAQYKSDLHRFYYGLTWLSEEFEAQTGSQVVGSVTIDFAF